MAKVELLVAFFLLFAQCLGDDTGLRLAISSKGMDYARQVGVSILEQSLKNLKIPDLSGSERFDIGIGHITVHWSVSNGVVQGLNIPTSALKPGSGDLTLSASGISASATAHINVNDGHDFPHVSASCDMSISFSGVAFSIGIVLGKDSSGHATITSSGCSASVGSAKVDFHGGSSWIYKVVNKIADFDGLIKKNFAPTFCKGVTGAIDEQGNKALESVPVKLQIDKYAQIDYALTENPAYAPTYVATFHKGEFESVAHPTEAPFSPPPLPAISGSDQMVYIWLTDYIANTAGLVYHQMGVLAYNITPEMVPSASPIKLNTSSFEFLIPQLYKQYPNMPMLLTVATTKPPQVDINPASANFTVIGEVNVQVMFPNKTIQSVATLGLTVYMNAFVWVRSNGVKQLVMANVSLLSFSVNVLTSHIGTINTDPLNKAVQWLVKLFIVPAANAYGMKGLELPLVDGLSFVTPKISFGNGYVLISSDISYKPTQ